MSSDLFVVNWTPFDATPTLNGKQLSAIAAAQQRDQYLPYNLTVDRDSTQEPKVPGEWGRQNDLTVSLAGGSGTIVYNDVPDRGETNIPLYLWIFPDFLVFSQLAQQVGERVTPDSSASTLVATSDRFQRVNVMALGTAYFINATPTTVKITLNGGDQVSLDAIAVVDDGAAVRGPAQGYPISANKGPDVFGGNADANELTARTEQTGTTSAYIITSTVPTTLDLYFFIFEDTVVGEDVTGSSSEINVDQLNVDSLMNLARTLTRDA